MKIRMLTSSTLAPKGKVIDRPEAEARRLIEVGHAEPADEDDFDRRLKAMESDVAELKERVAALKPKAETAVAPQAENAAKQTEKPKPRAKGRE